MSSPKAGWLYDGDGLAIGTAPQFSFIPSWHVTKVIQETCDNDFDVDKITRVWYMPPGTDPLPIAQWVLDELRTSVAQGDAIAILATSQEAMDRALAVLWAPEA
jgi:hypothetical protein